MQPIQRQTAHSQQPMDTSTVLIIFVETVILLIYLISMTFILIRKTRKLMTLKNRKYYIIVTFYVGSKLIVCSILLIAIIVGVSDKWNNLKGPNIQLLIKTGLIIADFCIIQMFLIGLQTYFQLCFSVVGDSHTKKKSKKLNLVIKLFQLMVGIIMLVPLLVYDINDLGYSLMNKISIGINSFVLVSFFVTFFYLNLKMTGLMMEPTLNYVIKRLYKIQLIILISRIFIITFQILVLKFVPDSFEAFVQDASQDIDFALILALLFMGSIVLLLLSQGLPIMYSMRNSVVEALDYKLSKKNIEKPFLSNYNSEIEHSQLTKQKSQSESAESIFNKNLSLLSFTTLKDFKSDNESSICIKKIGMYCKKQFVIKIAKFQISSYILQDIQSDIYHWNHKKIKYLSKITYFSEADIIHFVQKYYSVDLDQKLASEALSETQILKIGLQIAEAISQIHYNDLVHGNLSPKNIFFDNQQVVITGYGLISFKKYLSLLTGYTNKSMYTAVEYLKDKNKVVIKPVQSADIYSFGMILYEMLTKNVQYRQLSLSQIKTKLCDQNIRPKLPDHIKSEIKNLIRKCWHELPDKRPNIGEVVNALKLLI